MNLRKALSLGCLALCLALPGTAQEARQCSEAALQKWLSGCAGRLRVRNAHRSLPPMKEPRDPWAILQSSEILMEEGPYLAERIVEECSAAERVDVASGLTAPEVPCEERDRREWLAGCVDEALAFVGKTRAEISAAFREDGGIGSPDAIRYLSSRCPYLKLGVSFDFGRDSDGRGEMRPGDRILDVEPYLGSPLTD
ncbi:MAG: hypothetical protein ACJ76J_20620 [Thermoanaerobaculia bacterium]